MKIIATPCKGKDLLPGDLFSIAGPDYWNYVDLIYSIGEKVFIRMNTPSRIAPDENEEIFKITIEK